MIAALTEQIQTGKKGAPNGGYSFQYSWWLPNVGEGKKVFRLGGTGNEIPF